MRSIASRAALAALIVLGAAAAARSDAPPDPTRITLADFKKQLDAGKLVVIDVRSTETYRADHIPGSISVPLSVVQDRAAELKASRKPIVAYCAWASEHSSARAAQLLGEAGIKNVRALLGGWNAWVNANYPVVKGDDPR